MKRTTQSNPRLQSLLLAAIATIILLGASAATFAQNTANHTRFALDSFFSSTASQNLWLQNSLDKFALTNFHANALFATTPTPVFGQPTPDFSAMEKWYEVVKYEYGDPATDRRLYIWAKPKTEVGKRPGGFYIEFRDKDGALVGDQWAIVDTELNLYPVGKVAKAYCYGPTELQLETVVTATVVRAKH